MRLVGRHYEVLVVLRSSEVVLRGLQPFRSNPKVPILVDILSVVEPYEEFLALVKKLNMCYRQYLLCSGYGLTEKLPVAWRLSFLGGLMQKNTSKKTDWVLSPQLVSISHSGWYGQLRRTQRQGRAEISAHIP